MKIVAANWKLFKGPQQARDFLQSFVPQLDDNAAEVVIFPPALTMDAVLGSLKGTKSGRILVGLQNCYAKSEGAFTGENSAQTAKEMGVSYVLIGHSERRTLFGETDETIAQKVALVQSLDLTPMLCIGETLKEREAGQTHAVLEKQLRIGLAQAAKKDNLVVAYEPVWAIGTGKVATAEQVAEAHAQIAALLKKLEFEEINILYGGSVKPDNAASLIQLEHVGGFLVGGASLEIESFSKIVKAGSV